MSWLNEILEAHNESESPQSFWYWAALTSVSAVIKDNVYVDRYYYKLYPNIYVMLHADSGLKKGPPVSMANKLVTLVNNTKIISGRFSIQGLLKKMSVAETTPGGGIKKSNHVFICSSELSSSIVSDPVATDILTDLYDRHYRSGHWESILKQEDFKLNDPCVCMLSATNEAHNEEFFAKKDLQGGFFARTFIIHESKRHRINSLAFAPKVIPDYTKFADYLRKVAGLKGEMQWNDTARKYYDDWYNEFINSIDEQKLDDPTGTVNRFGDSVLKVAMLMALASEPKLEIPLWAIKQSIEQCEKLIGNVRKTTGGSGKAAHSQEQWFLINLLINREPHMISRQMLNKLYWMRASLTEWDDICLSLEAANIISIEPQGNQVMYVMSDKVVKEMKDHLKGRVRK